MAQADGDVCFFWGKNMFKQPDVRIGARGGKADGLLVQMLLESSVRGVVIIKPICIFHPYVIGDFIVFVNYKKTRVKQSSSLNGPWG